MKFLFPLLVLTAVLRGQEKPSFDYRPATVVVYNAKVPDSLELAQYYAKQRGIPERNLVGLKCSSETVVSRELFKQEIETPLRAEFDARQWWEVKPVQKEGLLAVRCKMRVLAIMQGIPLGIGEQPQKDAKTGQPIPAKPGEQNAACVDSELAALGVIDKPIAGRTMNPYYKSVKEFAQEPYAPLFLVGRLDGPDKATVKRMIDDAIAVEKAGLYGKAYVDLARKTSGGYEVGENWLLNAARILAGNGLPVMVDTWATTFPVNYPMHDAAFYLGWYTGDADGPFLNPAFKFRRGAVAVHLHSFSAANLHTTKSHWCGPLLAKGACVTLGNVFEPYLGFTASLDVFADRMLKGYTFGEAAWNSTPVLSWMNTAVGDPLYRPFALQPGDGDKKSATDYKAIRLALTRWGKPEESKELTENLATAAENLKSVNIYEFLAMRAQASEGKVWAKAEPWFRLAEKTATAPEDKIRLQFLMADVLRRDEDLKGAEKVLNEVVSRNPKAPEAATARAILQQLK